MLLIEPWTTFQEVPLSELSIPAVHGLEDVGEPGALLRESVLDTRRNLVVGLAQEQTRFREFPEALGERAGIDPRRRLEFGEPARILGLYRVEDFQRMRASEKLDECLKGTIESVATSGDSNLVRIEFKLLILRIL